jgi:hypothetical protein
MRTRLLHPAAQRSAVTAGTWQQHACGRRRASSALLFAAETGHKSVAELLLSCGADVNARPGRSASVRKVKKYENTSFWERTARCRFRSPAIFRFAYYYWTRAPRCLFVCSLCLVSRPPLTTVQHEAVSRCSFTALHFAAKHNHYGIVRLLVANNADTNVRASQIIESDYGCVAHRTICPYAHTIACTHTRHLMRTQTHTTAVGGFRETLPATKKSSMQQCRSAASNAARVRHCASYPGAERKRPFSS